MIWGRQHRHPAAKSGARTLFTFAALLALALQAFIVQTHVHAFGGPAAGIERAQADSADAVQVSTGHAQTACVICLTLTATGRAALSGAAALSAEHRATYETATLIIRHAPLALAHSWQSRAPPIAL